MTIDEFYKMLGVSNYAEYKEWYYREKAKPQILFIDSIPGLNCDISPEEREKYKSAAKELSKWYKTKFK